MQISPARGLFSVFRGGRGFLVGLLCGTVMALAGTALAEDADKKAQFAEALLRAIAELAIDTERNAINIVELRQRIDNLEHDLAEAAGNKD